MIEATTAPRLGRSAVIEQLIADGVRYMFGNPGTVEQGFLDSLGEYRELEYVLALHETIAVGMADGYARATKRPAIVQLHSGVGLGNGIGMIYQAKRGHAPLVVVAGESGVRYDAMDAQMACDLVSMARPVTKWATRVVDPTSVLRVLRRAVKIAGTPPMGPVFVALPMDVLDARNDEAVVPTSFPVTSVVPEREVVHRAAAMLAEARRPMIIAGDGIAAAGAQAELARVAELTGAEVWGADWSEVNLDHTHPQFMGLLGHMFGDHSRGITSGADVVLICGTYVFPEVFPALEGVFAEGARVVHVDLDSYEIGKNFPVDLGIVSDPGPTLSMLATALSTRMTGEQRAAAGTRRDELAARTRADRERDLQQDRCHQHCIPMHASLFAQELAAQLPADAIVFDEALTTSPELTRYLRPTRPGQYFLTRGGSLGVGIPGALGVKLANPDRTVVALVGDGASMYTIQALWTAARHDIDAKFVICNNRSYELLKLNIREYWREREIPEHAFPSSFDLATPEIRFMDLAHGLGIGAAHVDKASQIKPAIRRALAHPGPFLIDLVIANQVHSSREIPGAARA